jgi:hypothetical protein
LREAKKRTWIGSGIENKIKRRRRVDWLQAPWLRLRRYAYPLRNQNKNSSSPNTNAHMTSNEGYGVVSSNPLTMPEHVNCGNIPVGVEKLPSLVKWPKIGGCKMPRNPKKSLKTHPPCNFVAGTPGRHAECPADIEV